MFKRLRDALLGSTMEPTDDIIRLRQARNNATRYRFCAHHHMPQQEQQKGISPKPKMTWSPHLRALLEGVHDDDSPLSMLRGLEDSILKQIYKHHIEGWEDSVTLTSRCFHHHSDNTSSSNEIAFAPCARVRFPPPRDINVNMLPFVLGDVNSLPKDLHPYYDTIVMECPLQSSEIGKVLYLTVQEGWVDAGSSQRRGGLHIESPRHTDFLEKPNHFEGHDGWGRGMVIDDSFIGGLYMASTVSNSCRVYHALVDKTAVDSHGGLDYLRHMIPTDTHGRNMDYNELVWMTDRTPHEVLPQAESEYRQFFRLVTSSLSIWNAVHNTPNPKVPLPKHVKVVHDSRFVIAKEPVLPKKQSIAKQTAAREYTCGVPQIYRGRYAWAGDTDFPAFNSIAIDESHDEQEATNQMHIPAMGKESAVLETHKSDNIAHGFDAAEIEEVVSDVNVDDSKVMVEANSLEELEGTTEDLDIVDGEEMEDWAAAAEAVAISIPEEAAGKESNSVVVVTSKKPGAPSTRVPQMNLLQRGVFENRIIEVEELLDEEDWENIETEESLPEEDWAAASAAAEMISEAFATAGESTTWRTQNSTDLDSRCIDFDW